METRYQKMRDQMLLAQHQVKCKEKQVLDELSNSLSIRKDNSRTEIRNTTSKIGNGVEIVQGHKRK